MVLKQPDINVAKQMLADWWLNNSTISSLELKEELRRDYPDYMWNQQWVSWFLGQTDHPYEDVGTYKIYHINSTILSANYQQLLPTAAVTTTSPLYPVSIDSLDDLGEDYHGIRLTKEKIKSLLKDRFITDFTDFDGCFENSGWVFTGKYTADNKKIYVWIHNYEYFSRSKQQILRLSEISKPHLRNALLKRYPNVTIEYLVNNPFSEASKLLKHFSI